MSPENLERYNAMVGRINAMEWSAVEQLIGEDKCPFEPQHMTGMPLGMFHCEVCGEMVVAGLNHPRNKKDLKNEQTRNDH